MNMNTPGFSRNFRITAERNGEQKEFGGDSRWYTIADAHTLELQGYTILAIQKWNSEAKDYVDDFNKEGVSSLVVLRDRYPAKAAKAVDMETSDRVGDLASAAKTIAAQARKGSVEQPTLDALLLKFFTAAKAMGVEPGAIIHFSTQLYPELQPRGRREHQEANA